MQIASETKNEGNGDEESESKARGGKLGQHIVDEPVKLNKTSDDG